MHIIYVYVVYTMYIVHINIYVYIYMELQDNIMTKLINFYNSFLPCQTSHVSCSHKILLTYINAIVCRR